MAALFNALKIVGKPIESLRVLMLGLGAAGVACTKMMQAPASPRSSAATARARSPPTASTTSTASMSPIKHGSPTTPTPRSSAAAPNDVIEGATSSSGCPAPA